MTITLQDGLTGYVVAVIDVENAEVVAAIGAEPGPEAATRLTVAAYEMARVIADDASEINAELRRRETARRVRTPERKEAADGDAR